MRIGKQDTTKPDPIQSTNRTESHHRWKVITDASIRNMILKEVYMDTLPKSIGIRIRELRIEKKIKLQSLAIKCMITKKYLTDIEKGYITPDFELLIFIAKHLNTSTDYLLTGMDTLNTTVFSQKEVPILSDFENNTYTSFSNQSKSSNSNMPGNLVIPLCGVRLLYAVKPDSLSY